MTSVIMESLADGGVMMGLPRDVAVELAAQALSGNKNAQSVHFRYSVKL